MRPYLVGIAGPSCSGKSLLAKRLAMTYAEQNPYVLTLDSYYRDLSGIEPEQRNARNFDIPDAIDLPLLQQQLETLCSGEAIARPTYDFITHTRSPHTERVADHQLILVEGLFVLYWEAIRRLFQMSIFVTVSEQQALSRRLARDTQERGRSKDSIVWQYTSTVGPMSQKYVVPTLLFADLVVMGMDPVERSLALVRERLDRVLSQPLKP
jgi:uridine kinase